MARKNGRAPNFSLINNRPFGAMIQLSFFGKDEEHAVSIAMELTNILAMAGYSDLLCAVIDPHDGHLIKEFALVKEDDGEEDEEAPPETV